MNIFTKLKYLTDLTDNEKEIVAYLLANPERFTKKSASEIAKECFVSMSSIYRLCNKLEMGGLSELKVQISASLSLYNQVDEDFDFDFPVRQYQTQYQMTQSLKEDYYQTINSTLNLIDLEELRKVVYGLKKAHQIDIYTSAGNIYFAENFKFQMQEIGINVNVPIEEYHQRLTASASDSNHIAIIISFGGRGGMVRHVFDILKKNNTPIICITSHHEDNPIMGLADYELYLCSFEDHYKKVSSFSTRLSLLYILDCLYASYFELDYDSNVDLKLKLYKQLSGMKGSL